MTVVTCRSFSGIIIPPLTLSSLKEHYSEKMPIEKMPTDTLNYIFSFLDVESLYPIQLINKKLKACAINVANTDLNLASRINNFIQLLIDNLNNEKYASQIPDLTAFENTLSQEKRSLARVKQDNDQVTLESESIIAILNTIAPEDLKIIFENNLPKLMSFFSDFDIVDLIDDYDLKDFYHKRIAENLIKERKIDQAIKSANSICDKKIRTPLLIRLCELLLQKNRANKAPPIAIHLQDQNRNENLFEYIKDSLEILISQNKTKTILDLMYFETGNMWPFLKGTILTEAAQIASKLNKWEDVRSIEATILHLKRSRRI